MARKKFIVGYTSSTDHDSCKVWVYANDADDAVNVAHSEYWDIESVDFVREL